MNEKPTIAIDMDGVLAKWDDGTHDAPGTPIPGAVELTERLSKFARIVVYTCRCTPSEYPERRPGELHFGVANWLHLHGFHVDGVWSGVGKPSAVLYIDDRGFRFRPGEKIDPESAESMIRDLVMSEDRITKGVCRET